MGEAVNPGETLRLWDRQRVADTALNAVRKLPAMIAAGWRADTDRYFLFVPVLMGIGIGVYFALPVEPPLWSAAVVVPIALGWQVARASAAVNTAIVLAALAATALGFSCAVVRAALLDQTLVTRETRQLTLTGRVAHLEVAERNRTRILLDLASSVPATKELPRRVRVSVPALKEPLSPGDWIEIRGTLKPLPAPVAPGSYDFGRKLWFDGIGAVGFSLAPVKKIASPRPDTWTEDIASAITSFRRAVSERIRAAMSERTGPIAAAFLTGERDAISDEDNEAMRDSSLAHLLSISGLHMALAGFGFFWALRLLFALAPPIVLNYPVKKWAAAAALVASFAYLLLSGASVPTQRSFVMIAIALIAMIFDRSAMSLRVVALAAIAILLVSPESWIDPSFQMSFAAVVALVAVYEWWNANRVADLEPPGWIRYGVNLVLAAAATSLIAGLATAPFAAFHFNRFSDYGVAANVLVTPIVSFVIMPAGVLALLLMPFGLEPLPLAVMEKGLDAMLGVAHWVASWPGATQAVAATPPSALILMAAGGIWLALWRSNWRWFGVAPVVIGLIVPFFTRQPDIFIADDGANVAVRGADGQLHLLSSRRGKFDAEIWLRRDGDSREVADLPRDDGAGFVCDSSGCLAPILGRDDRKLLVAWSGEAIAEDCANATIVIDMSRGWRDRCEGRALLVTPAVLNKEGAIAAELNDDGITWTSVSRERGVRPWTATPR